MWRRATQLLIVISTLAATSAAGFTRTVGSEGVGDRLFPNAGNGGYDVVDYQINGSWDPRTRVLTATAHLRAVATQDLNRFNLDLRGFTVTSIDVNGRSARFTRNGQELAITPARAVRASTALSIDVEYRGKPQAVVDPDGSTEGWMSTTGGAVALGEPQGAPSWFPANDHPTDKATFGLQLTVPNDLVVVSNGQPRPVRRSNGRTTYGWRESKPMAPYLATVAIGHFKMTTSSTANGTPIISAVEPTLAQASEPTLQRIPEMFDWLTGLLGEYPFDSIGAIVVDAPDVGYDLETQDRPTFTRVPDDSVMVHELAHQWIGNSISVAAWQEMWLNEGFAGYIEWLWSEHDGGPSARESFDFLFSVIPADDAFWSTPIGPTSLPDATSLFSEPVYLRGAMTLQALRNLIGDAAFFQILQTWTTDHRYGNVTTEQFIALAESISGQSLRAFFTTWLDTPSKPTP